VSVVVPAVECLIAAPRRVLRHHHCHVHWVGHAAWSIGELLHVLKTEPSGCAALAVAIQGEMSVAISIRTRWRNV
jgi:hypothetical protein